MTGSRGRRRWRGTGAEQPPTRGAAIEAVGGSHHGRSSGAGRRRDGPTRRGMSEQRGPDPDVERPLDGLDEVPSTSSTVRRHRGTARGPPRTRRRCRRPGPAARPPGMSSRGAMGSVPTGAGPLKGPRDRERGHGVVAGVHMSDMSEAVTHGPVASGSVSGSVRVRPSGPLSGRVPHQGSQELGAQADGGDPAGARAARAAQRAATSPTSTWMSDLLAAMGVTRRVGPTPPQLTIDSDGRPSCPRRPTSWSSGCGRRSSCSARCSPAAARPGSPCPAATTSGPGRSTCTCAGSRRWAPTFELAHGYIEARPTASSAPGSCSSSRASAPPRTC